MSGEVKDLSNSNDEIKNYIYTIRGKQVLLDRDLAKLYNCKNGAKTINQAVKRNIERFPQRFMFQLSEEDYSNLRSQIGTAKIYIKDKKSSICFYRIYHCGASIKDLGKKCFGINKIEDVSIINKLYEI